MRKTEAQTLGILGIIAIGIIVLCTWGGGQPSLDEMDQQLANAEAIDGDADHEGGSRESGSTLVVTHDTGRPVQNSHDSEQRDVQDIIEQWQFGEHNDFTDPELHRDPEEDPEVPGSEDPIPVVPEATTHVVVAGETLSGISKKHFETVTRWKDSLKANKDLLSAPEDLRPGMKLVIPTASGAVTPTTTATTTPPTATRVAGTTSTARTYKVKKGDTLYGIAMRFYNSGSQHKKLLRANRDQLGTPKDLRPDMVLDIP